MGREIALDAKRPAYAGRDNDLRIGARRCWRQDDEDRREDARTLLQARGVQALDGRSAELERVCGRPAVEHAPPKWGAASVAERHAPSIIVPEVVPNRSIRRFWGELAGTGHIWFCPHPASAVVAPRAVEPGDAIAPLVLASPGYGYRRKTMALQRAGPGSFHSRW